MRLSVRASLAPLLLLGLGLGALSCGDSTAPPNGATVVQVNDNAFSPATQTVAVGGTVEWQWNGANPHNVTWVTTSGAGNSATQSSGIYDRTFSAAGTYDYYCTIHGSPTGGMHGSVVVQ